MMIRKMRMKFYYITVIVLVSLAIVPERLPLAQETSDTNAQAGVLDVVIVGAGIAGLTCAYYLDLDDYDIMVLEKRDSAGGRAFSLQYKQIVYAGGAEYLGRLTGPLKEIADELDLTVREIPYPMDVYLDENRFYYGGMGCALLAAKKSSLSQFIRFGKTIQKIYRDYEDVPDLDLSSPLARLDDISAYDWFVEKKFSRFYIDRYNVTFRGLFGANIHEISALSALSEIAFDFENVDMDDEFGSLEDMENDPTPGKYHTGSYSFDAGLAQIPIALAEDLGNAVVTGALVVRVEKKDDLIVTTYLDRNNQRVSIESESVVLATPAPVTLKIADDVLSTEQKQILKTIEYAPYVTLALYSSEPIFDKGFDLAVPDTLFFTDIYDATWISRFYDNELKKAETFITTVYISSPSYKDLSILSLPDEEILKNVYSDLEKILPGSVRKIEGHRIFRFTHGYPVMTKGAYKRLTRLHEITAGPVVLAGDYTIYPTFEAAADSGVLAAEKISDYLED